MYVIKNERGEYWTGKMILKKPYNHWEMYFCSDESMVKKMDMHDLKYMTEELQTKYGIFEINAIEIPEPSRDFCKPRKDLPSYTMPPTFPSDMESVPFMGYNETEVPVKTISEICIEADNNKDSKYVLNDIWKTTMFFKRKYPLAELQFIREHVQKYLDEIESKESVDRFNY